MSPLFDLGGKRALVTGSSQGIGLALAEGLAAHGADVVINGRDAAKVDRAVRKLQSKGHRVRGMAFDVTRPDVAGSIDRIEADIGAIDGIGPGYVRTPLNQALVDNQEFSAWLEKRTPAGRWGDVEELVGAAVFLAGRASSFVNGHMLYVDGGITTVL